MAIGANRARADVVRPLPRPFRGLLSERRGCLTSGEPCVIFHSMDADREAMEAEFIAEILRIVGPGADAEDYAVAPETSDELLEIRVQRLRELPSGIGHEELMRRVGPKR